MISVSYSPEVIEYLKNLITILYDKGYFCFPENAKEYVDRITLDIENNIASKSKRKAPKYFERYGKDLYYVTYRPNRHTSWYVFFNVRDTRYLIRYITNNHVSAQHLKGL
ncbi:MAG TPA: hypothetical protein VHO90_04660 [Bacteroidales bacterium]|nr:hypothetical protein [Bacteroidales bacterium]